MHCIQNETRLNTVVYTLYGLYRRTGDVYINNIWSQLVRFLGAFQQTIDADILVH